MACTIEKLSEEDQQLDAFLIEAASLHVLETLMKRHTRYQPYNPKWYDNEKGQNIRKPEFKGRRPTKLPKNLKPVFAIEVQMQVKQNKTPKN